MNLLEYSLLLLTIFKGIHCEPSSSKGNQTLSGPEQVALMKIGTRVVRGDDWEWYDQDGGPGGVGTIISEVREDKHVRVMWDVGGPYIYRVGKNGKYDLKLAPTISSTSTTTSSPTSTHYEGSMATAAEELDVTEKPTIITSSSVQTVENSSTSASSSQRNQYQQNFYNPLFVYLMQPPQSLHQLYPQFPLYQGQPVIPSYPTNPVLPPSLNFLQPKMPMS